MSRARRREAARLLRHNWAVILPECRLDWHPYCFARIEVTWNSSNYWKASRQRATWREVLRIIRAAYPVEGT